MAFRHRLAWAAAIAAVVVAPQAQAAFSAPKSLGPTEIVGDVACAGAGKTGVCAGRTVEGKFAVNRLDGSDWSGWKTIGSGLVSSPSCTTVSDTAALCAARHSSGGLIVARYAKSWSKPQIVEGDLNSAPSCAGVGTDSAVCVARGIDGTLGWLKTDGAVSGSFAKLSGPVSVPPRCSPDNRIAAARQAICLFGSPDGSISARRFDGTDATAAINLGGQSYFETACSELGKGAGGKVTCVAKNFNSNMFVNTFQGGAFTAANWTGFSGIGGLSLGSASCASVSFNQLGCALVGTDSQLFVFQFSNGAFSGYTALGGVFQGSPSCFTLAAGKVVCVAVGLDGVARSTVGP